jgi:hypothetical protein
MDELGKIMCGTMAPAALAIGIIIGHFGGKQVMQNQAIEKGHAEYSQSTGDWQWKEVAK